jgi:CubicO group peptidase (beta-lactamase class C family)
MRLGFSILMVALVVTAGHPRGAQRAPAPAVPTGEPFAQALALAAELPRLHSLLVSVRGEMVLERYFNGTRATRPANVKSVSKSIISALVGIAIARGTIPSVGTPISTWFQELKKSADPRKAAITIEDLLTMRSGLESTSNRNYGAWVNSRNWVQYALSRPLLAQPGTVMDYSTGNTHLLSAILTRASKTNTWQFAQDALAGPLGFTLARWPRDPQGIYFGGNDMELTPRQMIAFGELYLNMGRADDNAVVPDRWIEQSWQARGRSNWSGDQYGYGWWIRDLAGYQAFYAWGFGGQYIIVVPELQLVVATTSASTIAEDRRSHRRTVFGLVEHLIVGTLSSDQS